jgi:hypothetical protein
VLVSALQSRNIHYKKWALILFVTLYGSTIILGPGSDGATHLKRVVFMYSDMTVTQYFDGFADIIMLKNNTQFQDDLYIHTLSYITQSVFKSPHLFFVIVSMVYGYFFAGSMLRLFQMFPTYKKSILFFGLGVVFISWFNVDAMQSVRTVTGFWVLFYGFISFYRTGENKYRLLTFTAPLFHIAWFIMAIPAWVVLLAGNRKVTYSIMLLASFFVTLVGPEQVSEPISMTEVGQERLEGYQIDEARDIDYALDVYGASRWYKQYAAAGLQHWAILIILFTCLIFGTYFNSMNIIESSFLSAGILFITLSNTSWYIYALTNRSQEAGAVFILAAVLLYWQRSREQDKPIGFNLWQRSMITIAMIIFMPYLIFKLANFIQYFSIFMFLFPFLPWFSEDLAISVREFLGYFL